MSGKSPSLMNEADRSEFGLIQESERRAEFVKQ